MWSDPSRSGIGRFSAQSDLAALALLFTFGGFTNAFAMIRPVYAFRAWLAEALGAVTPAAQR